MTVIEDAERLLCEVTSVVPIGPDVDFFPVDEATELVSKQKIIVEFVFQTEFSHY